MQKTLLRVIFALLDIIGRVHWVLGGIMIEGTAVDHKVYEIRELDVIGDEQVELVETIYRWSCLLAGFRNILEVRKNLH